MFPKGTGQFEGMQSATPLTQKYLQGKNPCKALEIMPYHREIKFDTRKKVKNYIYIYIYINTYIQIYIYIYQNRAKREGPKGPLA